MGRFFAAAIFCFGLMLSGFLGLRLEPNPGQLALLTPRPDVATCPPNDKPGAYLYSAANFGGVCYHTTTAIADLGQTPLGDNNLASIQLRGWYVVKLYEHPYWQGQSLEIIVDDAHLDAVDRLDGAISSLRIYPRQELPIVSELRTASGQNYYLTRCRTGSEYYLDRDFKFTGFSNSDYDGLWCIKTANSDKENASAELLTFELNRPALIYIYFDRRMRQPPGWVNNLYQKNTKKVFVSDTDMDYFVVYSCNSHPGVITLGGPKFAGGQGSKAMYVVAFRESWGEQLCAGLEPPPTPTYTPTPVVTPTPTVTPTPAHNGDINGDGLVDIFDLAYIGARYGSNDSAADINHDGLVDIFDLTIVASHYGQSS